MFIVFMLNRLLGVVEGLLVKEKQLVVVFERVKLRVVVGVLVLTGKHRVVVFRSVQELLDLQLERFLSEVLAVLLQ